jgi:hypothetical protein
MLNPVIPDLLKTNEIPRWGSRSPPMKNNEGVFLGPYPQKTFGKGCNFRLVWKKTPFENIHPFFCPKSTLPKLTKF